MPPPTAAASSIAAWIAGPPSAKPSPRAWNGAVPVAGSLRTAGLGVAVAVAAAFALWITTRVSGGMPAHTSGAGTAPAGAVVSWNLTEAPTGTAGNATGAALQCSVIRGNV